jgi:uncharacterized protein (UPF0147 family)
MMTKKVLAQVYETLLLDPESSVTQFLEILRTDIIANDTVPTGILRLAIKTMTKVFDGVQPCNLEGYNPQSLIKALIGLQIDDHSNTIDAQELIWINIQQLILRLVKIYKMEGDLVIEFFFGLLDKRGFKNEQELGQTVHFSEKVKKNIIKLSILLFK